MISIFRENCWGISVVIHHNPAFLEQKKVVGSRLPRLSKKLSINYHRNNLISGVNWCVSTPNSDNDDNMFSRHFRFDFGVKCTDSLVFSVLWSQSVLFSLSITSGSGRIGSIEITSSICPFYSIDSEKGGMNYEP